MTKTERDSEVVRLLPVVRKVAAYMRRRLPPSLELDDLISEGTIGLMRAVERFDPKRGVKLEHFAARRIRGAMLDWLRREDPRSRPQREKQEAESLAGPQWQDRLAVPEVDEIPVAANQFELCLASEMRAALRQAVSRLHGREVEIITAHYGNDVTQDSIARQMRLDPSRISQLHGEALSRMRRSLGNAQQFIP